jgi:DNA-binding response OmpR family regulator
MTTKRKGDLPLVLVADDDDEGRRALSAALRSRGYRVQQASNGAEALEVLASAADGHTAMPDVVMLDVCMPEISGLGILSFMRRFAHPPPTFVLTGFSHGSVDMLANRSGAITVFHKPIDVDELDTAIHNVLRARRASYR